MKHILSASVVGLCMLPLDASAITVAVDYSDSTTSFFDDSPNGILAQKAVEAAAADISAAITTQLAPLDDDSFNSGGFTVIARLNYKNPDSGSSTNFSGDLAQDEFRLYVGARAIVDDETLGQGGPGGTVFGGSSAGNQAAANIAASAASTEMMRGSGVLISSRSASPSEETFTYSSDFGPAIGNLWFDNDASTSWHLDHTMAVASGNRIYIQWPCMKFFILWAMEFQMLGTRMFLGDLGLGRQQLLPMADQELDSSLRGAVTLQREQ